MMNHPNIIRALFSGTIAPNESNYRYLAMEYASGGTLRDLLKQNALPLEGRVELILQCARALQYVHNMGEIHMDLKPVNLLLKDHSQGSYFFLSDFGTDARAHRLHKNPQTRGSIILGTLGYMAPEQRLCQEVPASDQFSLAVIAFRVITGVRPEVVFDVPPYFKDYATSDLSIVLEELEDVIRRGMAVNVSDRYATVTEFAEALLSSYRSGIEKQSRNTKVFDMNDSANES